MLIIPTLVALGFLILGGKKVTLSEFAAQMGVQVLLMGMVAYGVSCQNTSDTETWNGQVTRKAREEVSCEHSYSCNCHQVCSGSGKDESCYEHCDTCYEHSYDVDWAVYSSINSRITIGRVSRQGLTKPSRWDAVDIGEPFAESRGYTNYIKGSPDTLFRHQGLAEKYQDKLPGYPGVVYDYYRMNRLVTVGLSVDDAVDWNTDLSDINSELGVKKQVNMVVVLTRDMPEEYYYALEQAWIGGKKNDAVLVVNTDSSGKVTWANVMAWTDKKMFQVALRDKVMEIGELNRTKIMNAFRVNLVEYYVRKPMKDFEYLSGLIRPTPGQWIFAMVFGLILSVGLGLFMLQNDVFNQEYRRW